MHIDINAAVAFAAQAHEGQTRKYTGAPYIVHPVEVMNIVRYAAHCEDSEMLAAAVLHDVVEDCDVELAEIADLFGERVAAMVDDLSNKFESGMVHCAGMNRAARKKAECTRLSQCDASTQTVKVADMIANTHDIVAFDPGFARVYLAEKEALLAALDRADPKLLAIARAGLDAGWATIGGKEESDPEDVRRAEENEAADYGEGA